MRGKIIFNADDFGMTQGVNAAIQKAYNEGILNSASLMVGQKYALKAVQMAKKMPHLELGLHVNLTNEYPVLNQKELPLLVGKDGKFKNGFLRLLLLSLLRPKALKKEVCAEIRAQIEKAQKMGVKLHHIDSHRHVHMIPLIFKVMLDLKEKYGIGRIRVMNESIIQTLRTNKSKSFLFDGGLIKYFLLRFFCILNGFETNTYFYTMLYTCKLSKDHFQKVLVPKGYEAVEIMIHPSIASIDKQNMQDVFDKSVLLPWREKELETLLDKSILKNFVFGACFPFLFELYFKVEKWWFKHISEKMRFLLVGGFNTVFAYAVYALLLEIIGLPYLWALIVQYFISVNVSIATMRYYVFQSKGNMLAEFLKAWSVYIGLFFLNTVGLAFLVEVLKIDALFAQGIYLVFSTIITYLLHKYFSFKKALKKNKDSAVYHKK
ncbi:MAG: ChbG/HpnK family deacetylase [Alphaproteobacteria bacterium]|nr:ChbG/HpnK family deacetylase [Alphaproteobacteria bacterium]